MKRSSKSRPQAHVLLILRGLVRANKLSLSRGTQTGPNDNVLLYWHNLEGTVERRKSAKKRNIHPWKTFSCLLENGRLQHRELSGINFYQVNVIEFCELHKHTYLDKKLENNVNLTGRKVGIMSWLHADVPKRW